MCVGNLLWLGCSLKMAPKPSYVGSLIFTVIMLGSGGTFKMWSLLEDRPWGTLLSEAFNLVLMGPRLVLMRKLS
jgi:hypothetical protein